MAISYDWPAEGERSLIGKRINRLDGPDKATGRAKYAYDRNVTGMVVARLVTSPHAHARITAIDTSAAERAPGFRGVEIINGVGTEVQWQGLEIAAVAADTVQTFPSETYDHVITPGSGPGQFVSSSYCMSCHDGLTGPFGPVMFLPPGPAATTRSRGWRGSAGTRSSRACTRRT